MYINSLINNGNIKTAENYIMENLGDVILDKDKLAFYLYYLSKIYYLNGDLIEFANTVEKIKPLNKKIYKTLLSEYNLN